MRQALKEELIVGFLHLLSNSILLYLVIYIVDVYLEPFLIYAMWAKQFFCNLLTDGMNDGKKSNKF